MPALRTSFTQALLSTTNDFIAPIHVDLQEREDGQGNQEAGQAAEGFQEATNQGRQDT
jgi:hypothetical protein